MVAIILAGGFGKRLRSVVDQLPKPMAPVSNEPFLAILLDYAIRQGITRIFLSVGYKHECILKYFNYRYQGVPITYIIEEKPLGTGGAIKKALDKINSQNVLIMNGDSFFKINFRDLYGYHDKNKAQMTIAVKEIHGDNRYNDIIMDNDNKIIDFQNERLEKSGFVHGGVYIIKNNLFDGFNLPESFSIENDFLKVNIQDLEVFGFISEGYFIDIGVPEDYKRAQEELLRCI